MAFQKQLEEAKGEEEENGRRKRVGGGCGEGGSAIG